jgi:hypothetical protein
MKATSTHKTSKGILLACIFAGLFFAQLMAQPGKPATMTVAVQAEVPAAASIQPGTGSFPVKMLRMMGLDSVQLSQTSHCKFGKSDTLSFATAKLMGDTLQIDLLDMIGDKPAMLKVEVVKDQFHTLLVLFEDGGKIEIIPTDQVLVLPKLEFKAGETIEGFVNFRGTNSDAGKAASNWSVQKDWVPSTHTVRGAFKVTIR